MDHAAAAPWLDGGRCAVAARGRRDGMAGTAGTEQRLLLIEVNGPWGRDALRASRLDAGQAVRLDAAAQAAGVRPLLIRRPGRPIVAARGGLAAARVDLRPGSAAVAWHHLADPGELLDLDLRGPVPTMGRRVLALVCTHGRHDLCCAVEGRPVAAALAQLSGWDVWECSHLGGDRFAANVLLLPSGDLFGGLDAATALSAVTDYRAGRITLEHHRGRFGRPRAEQAAVHHLRTLLSERRRDAVQVESMVEAVGEGHWQVDLSHRPAGQAPEQRYRVRLDSTWSEPSRLTCSAEQVSRVPQLIVQSCEPLPAG